MTELASSASFQLVVPDQLARPAAPPASADSVEPPRATDSPPARVDGWKTW